MNVGNLNQIARGLERLATNSSPNSPLNSPLVPRRKALLDRPFSSSVGSTPLGSPSGTRIQRCKSLDRSQSRGFSSLKTTGLATHAESSEDTPMDVFLYRIIQCEKDDPLLQDRLDVLFRTRTVLNTAGIASVGQLKEREHELEKIGLHPTVVQKIKSVFGSPPQSPAPARFEPMTLNTTAAVAPQIIPKIVIEPTPAEEMNSTSPSLGQGSWMWNHGTSRPLLSKTAEQQWSDYAESRDEVAWMRTEKAQLGGWKVAGSEKAEEDPLKYFTEWKDNTPGKFNQPWRPAVSNINPDASARPDMVYSQQNIQINTPSNLTQSPKPRDAKAQKAVFDEAGRKLGVRSMSDWYFINLTDLNKLDALQEILTTKFGGSLSRALVETYPEYNWKPWNFDYGYKGIFNDPEADSASLSTEKTAEAKPQGNIRSQDRTTTVKQYQNHWQVRLFSTVSSDSWAHEAAPYSRPKSAPKISLMENEMQIISPDKRELPVFPDTMSSETPKPVLSEFEPANDRKESLFAAISQILPHEQILKDYSGPEFVYSDTKREFELGAYIPALKIGFEFVEDPNHSWQYTVGAKFSPYIFSAAKKEVCDSLGITLIEVPSWWDGKIGSLSSAIKRIRPDVFPMDARSPSFVRDMTKAYFLSKRKKGMDACLGCNERFGDDTEFVIQAGAPNKEGGHVFCLDANCIQKAKHSHGMPSFDGKVKLSPEIKHGKSIPEGNGIQYVE